MGMSKSNARKIVVKCAKLYKDNLCNKKMLFVYEINSKIKYVNVSCYPSNYKHLTGIDTVCSARDFFELCCNQKISEDTLVLKRNGTTELKLKVLEQIMDIAHQVRFIGDYLNSNIYLELDKIVGNISCGLGIENNEGNSYYPKSVLNGDIRKQIVNMHPIIAVFEKLLWEPNYKIVKMNGNLTEKKKQTIYTFVDSDDNATTEHI
jgi:hypothetical protein